MGSDNAGSDWIFVLLLVVATQVCPSVWDSAYCSSEGDGESSRASMPTVRKSWSDALSRACNCGMSDGRARRIDVDV